MPASLSPESPRDHWQGCGSVLCAPGMESLSLLSSHREKWRRWEGWVSNPHSVLEICKTIFDLIVWFCLRPNVLVYFNMLFSFCIVRHIDVWTGLV